MEFAVADDTYPVDELDVDVPDIFSTVPDLYEVLLTGPDLATYSPVLAIPWRQITRYRFYSSGRQLDILENASNLIECGITDEDDTDDLGDDCLFSSPSTLRPIGLSSKPAQRTRYCLSCVARPAR
jgi:hypothetical protein